MTTSRESVAPVSHHFVRLFCLIIDSAAAVAGSGARQDNSGPGAQGTLLLKSQSAQTSRLWALLCVTAAATAARLQPAQVHNPDGGLVLKDEKKRKE